MPAVSKESSWPSPRTDLSNAGAHWLDEPVVTDNPCDVSQAGRHPGVRAQDDRRVRGGPSQLNEQLARRHRIGAAARLAESTCGHINLRRTLKGTFGRSVV
jgi:hypothetical protein